MSACRPATSITTSLISTSAPIPIRGPRNCRRCRRSGIGTCGDSRRQSRRQAASSRPPIIRPPSRRFSTLPSRRRSKPCVEAAAIAVRGAQPAIVCCRSRGEWTGRDAMAGEQNWVDVGAADELARSPLKRVTAAGRPLAISFRDGRFGAVANACNHVGGPLGDGRLDGDYIVCPWHNWKFHRCTGFGEPGFEEDRVPSYPVKVENGRLLVDVAAGTRRTKKPHDPHPLARKVERVPGPLRLAGIATSAMDAANPRFSGSDHLLDHALRAARDLKAETRLIRLND